MLEKVKRWNRQRKKKEKRIALVISIHFHTVSARVVVVVIFFNRLSDLAAFLWSQPSGFCVYCRKFYSHSRRFHENCRARSTHTHTKKRLCEKRKVLFIWFRWAIPSTRKKQICLFQNRVRARKKKLNFYLFVDVYFFRWLVMICHLNTKWARVGMKKGREKRCTWNESLVKLTPLHQLMRNKLLFIY